jgi:phosphonate transport system substrate-binding protein
MKGKSMWRKTLVALLVLLPLSAVQAQELAFTAIPDQDESRLQQRFAKVSQYLQDELGITVRYVPVKSYAAAVMAFRNNQVQLAWFGGLSGVRARIAVPGSKAIAQGEEDPDFETYFIANTATGLQPGEDFPKTIQGRTFTFGSKGSTLGRLMPEFFIRQTYGRSPEDVFRRVGFSGDHSRTIALVQAGAYEVGAVNFKVWEKELALGKIDPEKVQIIWTTPPYADYQWTIRGDMDAQFGEGFGAKVQRALLALDDPAVLAAFPRKRFIPATNEDYAQILSVGRQVGLID